MSDYKMHFKMYKSGKLWIVAGIAATSLSIGGVRAYADTGNSMQSTAPNVIATPVSSVENQTNESSKVDSISGSVNNEGAPTKNESAAAVASDNQSSVSRQATTDDQNNNVQNTTVAKDTQSATTSASDSNTVVQGQTGTLPVNQVSGTTEVHQDGHWYLKDFQGNYLNGWQKLTDNRIVYYDPQNNQMQYGEHQINNQWYYFDTNCGAVVQGWYVLADGRKVYYDVANDGTGRGMLHGVQTIDGQTYDFNIYTGAQTSGWKIIDGQKYYFAPAMVHGMEKQIDGHWYCFDDMGKMRTGFVRLNDGREVYYNADGQMQYGEQKINDKWYHFQTDNGNMARGWYTLEDGRRVYYDVDADGNGTGMLYGLNQINNQSYYFDASDGDEKIGLQVVDNQTYYFNPIMVKNGEAKIGNHWYYFNAVGQMQTGFVTLKDGRLVYYNADGQMQYGEQKINGKWYHFQTDNGNTARGWYTLEDGRRVYYDVDNSGAGQGMLHGLQKVGSDYYYFNPGYGTEETGLKTVDGRQYYFAPTMVVNQEEHLADHWYYFGANGQMQTGFVTLKDGRLVYYNADGQMQYGEQKINGKWYHFQTDNGNTARGWYILEDGRRVYYDVDGTGNGQGMLHGLGKVGNDYYYFNDATGAKETGLKTLNDQTYNFVGNNGQALLSQFWINDNQTYYFDQQGQMVKNQQLTIAGEQWQFDANGVGTKVAVTIADNWNFDKKNSSELNNLGNIEGTTGEYNGLLIDASKPGAKFSPRDVGDTQVNANTVIGVPVKANQYGAKITIELSGGTVDLTTSQESQTGLKGTFTLTVPAMATDGTFSVTFNSSTYLKNLKVDYLTQAPEEYPGTPSNVKAEDTDWNLAAGSKQITAAQNSRAEYLGLKIDASTAGAKFAPRDNNDGTGLDTQINSGTIIYIPIAANQNGVTLKLTGQKSAGLTIMLNNQAVTLGNEIKIDATSTPTYLKIQFAGTGSAYLTDIAVHYNVAYPGTPTVSAKDADWNLSNDNSRPTVQNNQGEYNGLKIDGTNGKFAPRATDTQVNNGTIIYIPIAADAKGAKVTISGTANGQTLTLDGQSITLGTPVMLDATTARYLKLTVTGTGSAYLTGIDLDYLSDDSYQTHVVKVGANEQYKTIQSALDANQSSLKDRLVLAIDPGTYTEAVQVNKPGVIFKNADSTGQKAVVITYNNYSSNTFDANGNFVPQDSHDLGTSKCGTVIVTAAATGFSAENITFENSYNVTDHTKEGEQTPAVAFDSLADQVYLKNCSLIGRQDTVYLQGKGNRVYINGGKIEGTVDFVFGDANALIENAAINMAYYPGRKTGYFAAPNTAKGQTGLVFNNCQLTVDNQYGSNAVIYLARPWQTTVQTTSKVVNGKTILTAYDPKTKDARYAETSSAATFINCQLPDNLAQNVFGVWTGKYEDASGKQSTVDITYHPDVRFVEFNNSTAADKKSLTDEKGNVLGTVQTGDASDYLKQVMSEMKIGTTAGAWQPIDKL